MKIENSSRFFANRECVYFPCHKGVPEEEFNCLFCYCPLYSLGDACGGDFTYTDRGIKDCSSCTRPHRAENYGEIVKKLTTTPGTVVGKITTTPGTAVSDRSRR